MRTKTFIKDPDSILDWDFNWNVTDDDEKVPWLEENEIITDYEITADDGITVVEDFENNGHVVVWLSGGEVPKEYIVSCKITTSFGRVEQRSILIKMSER